MFWSYIHICFGLIYIYVFWSYLYIYMFVFGLTTDPLLLKTSILEDILSVQKYTGT